MKISRQSKFIALSASSAWHPTGKLVLKLNQKETDDVINFLHENEDLTDDEYIEKCNRLFLDQLDKPKNYADIWAILIQCK